jgi:hypothetical protein
MSASSPFRSLKNPITKSQIAVQIATDAIEEYRALRMMAGHDAPESPEGMAVLQRLAVLMKGPHGTVVKPVVFQAFPELEPPKGTA